MFQALLIHVTTLIGPGMRQSEYDVQNHKKKNTNMHRVLIHDENHIKTPFCSTSRVARLRDSSAFFVGATVVSETSATALWIR